MFECRTRRVAQESVSASTSSFRCPCRAPAWTWNRISWSCLSVEIDRLATGVVGLDSIQADQALPTRIVSFVQRCE